MQASAMGDVLPFETLQNVQDLTFGCHIHSFDEPVWPTTWSQLTNLTRLSLHCKGIFPTFYLPEFLTGLRSLRDVGITTGFSQLNHSGEEYLVLLLGCLKQLIRLEIIVGTRGRAGVHLTNSKKYVGLSFVGCLASCPLLDVDTQSYHLEGRVVFTWER